MKEKNTYTRIVKILKSSRPELQDKELFAGEVMRRIREAPEILMDGERRVFVLFGWIHNTWLKGAMTAAAAILAAVFVFQQVAIAGRIDTLEHQLVRTMEKINGQEHELGIVQRVKFKMASGEEWKTDSVTVSRSDLEDLLDAYQVIRAENENIRQQLETAADSQNRKP